MRISNKLCAVAIIVSIAISLVCATIVRNSITKFEFKDIFTVASSLQYNPYNDIEYANESFVGKDKVKDMDSLYKYIIKGKATGNRKILDGTILTEIQVLDVLKGNINSKTIYIYEPIAIEKKSIWTFEGYNFIKDNKDYIFCLSDTKSKQAKDTYVYVTPFFGKFPLEYKDMDFEVFSEDKLGGKSSAFYNKFVNYEQVFVSKENKDKYISEYNKIMKSYNRK